MYRESLPSRLKEARKRTGFTQREVAKETGISHVTIARYESGTREPDIENLGTLAEFYEQSTDWLLGIVKKGVAPETRLSTEKERSSILKDTEKTAKKENRKAN